MRSLIKTIWRILPVLIPLWLLLCFSSAAFGVSDPDTFNFAVFGGKSVLITGGSYTDSYIGNPANRIKGQYKNRDVGTNATFACSVTENGGALVYGKARSGLGSNPATAICVSGGATLSGRSGALTAAKNMTPKTDPGGGTAMGVLSISNGGSKTIAAGTYRYTSITVGGGDVDPERRGYHLSGWKPYR